MNLTIPKVDTSTGAYKGPSLLANANTPKVATASNAGQFVSIAPPLAPTTPLPKVNTASPIPAASMTNTTTTYPAPTTSNVATNALGANLSSIQTELLNLQKEAEALKTAEAKGPVQTKGSGLSDALSQILSLGNKLGDKSSRSFDIQKEEGVFDKKKQATDLSNQYLSKTQYYDKLIEDKRKNAQGQFGGAVEQDIANIERQKNSELSDIAIQYKIANDDYTGAFEIAKARVDSEFEPIQAQIDTLKSYYQLAQNDMTESEKLAAQTEIQRQESELDFNRQKELYQYKQQIDQSDPLYQAKLANEQGGGAEGNADVVAYTAALQNGSATLAQVPQKLRGQVLANVQSTGTNKLLGLLGQYKDTINGLNFLSANTPGNKSLINTLKGQITAVYKQQQQLGTLDNGVQTLVDKIIPDPSKLSISSLSNKAQIEAIDNFIKNQGGSSSEGSTDFTSDSGKTYKLPY